MVYNNLCGDCKKMAPVWLKLAKQNEDNSEVVIAKIDGEKNHVEDLHVGHFPTFLYIPNGPKASTEQILYDGKAYEATLDDLKIWIEKCVRGECKNEE